MLTVPLKMNLQQTCRLCLGQGGVLSPIFLESVGGGEARRQSAAAASAGAPQPQPALPSRIMACAPIQVVEGDRLPAQICHRCLYQVERSYDFKEQCETSDRVLRQYVAQLLDNPAKPESGVGTKDVPPVVKLGKKESTKENIQMDLSSVRSSESLLSKEIKVNVLQSKLSALIHQTAVAAEEDVDSGLLESLADSDDLQIVGSEGDNVNIGEGEGHNLAKMQDDVSDKSESDEEIHLRCKMCRDTFPDVDLLELHQAAHEANGPPYSCSICDKVFTARSNLDAHWLIHSGENPLLCPVCETSFANSDSLESHLECHDISLPYFCVTCDKSFANRTELQKHVIVHSVVHSSKYRILPKEFARSSKLFKTLNGQKQFCCSECPKMFKTKGDMLRHEIIHTGQKPFSCSVCNLSFNRKDKLTRHERLHSSDKVFSYVKSDDASKLNLMYTSVSNGEEEPFQEEATDLSMPSKKETPMNIKSDSVDFNDDDSTMDTESDNQLQICEDPIDEGISDGHGSDKLDETSEKQSGVESMVISIDPFQMEQIDANSKHAELPSNFSLSSVKSEYEKEEYSPNENDVVENIQENTKPYACEFCPKKFADKSYMKTHQLTHLGIRPHACSYCGKGFFRRRELLRHEAVHTGIKPFTCKTCNKAFARSDKLMRHERTHGELKNFSCSQCPAVFSRKDELSRHGMCHTGERPHCCSQCFKSFFSRAELTRHEKTHAGLKPFKCEYCDQSFHRRDKLNRHARTHMMPSSLPSETNVLGTVHLHDLLAAHCGQHFASEGRVKDEKGEAGEELKVRVDGSIDARALARLNQNPDIHLIPLKQN